MNAQERALLATIRDRPDEDGPRLVYADWLDESGECARAEFIRVQCQRAAADAYDAAQPALAIRERELIRDYSSEWVGLPFKLFAPYAPPPDEPPFEPLDPAATRELAPQPRWYFRRGFPWAEVSPAQFLDHADMLLDAAQLVQLHIGGETYKEMMQRVRDPIGQRPRPDLFADLFESPRLAGNCMGLTLTDPSDWIHLGRQGRDLRLAALHGHGDGLGRSHLQELARSTGVATTP